MAQRVSHPAHEPEVGRAGEQEIARAPALVHRAFDCKLQRRGPLDFIQREIGAGRGERIDQDGLAGLPGARDHRDGQAAPSGRIRDYGQTIAGEWFSRCEIKSDSRGVD